VVGKESGVMWDGGVGAVGAVGGLCTSAYKQGRSFAVPVCER
jgi:hypothetical protein